METIFIGNSIIEYWNMTHPDFFKDNSYTSMGIAGETTQQILDRFDNDVIKKKPFVVFIEGGINDIAENKEPYELEKTFNNIVSMAEMANKKDIKVVLCSLLPTDSIHWNKNITDISHKVIDLNNQIKNYAKSKNFEYIDLYATLVDTNGKSMVKKYTTDGVHLSELGYSTIEPLVQEKIDTILETK